MLVVEKHKQLTVEELFLSDAWRQKGSNSHLSSIGDHRLSMALYGNMMRSDASQCFCCLTSFGNAVFAVQHLGLDKFFKAF